MLKFLRVCLWVCFIVAAWCAETYRLLFLSVCRSRFQQNRQSYAKKISHRQAVRRGRNLRLAVRQCRNLWTSAQEVPLGRQNTDGCKKISNAFLVHRFAERYEIWHNEGHWWVAGLRGFWWTLVHFSGSINFRQRMFRTLVVGARARRNLAVLGVWPISTYSPNLMNFGSGVPRHHAAKCTSLSLMHLLFIYLLRKFAQMNSN